MGIGIWELVLLLLIVLLLFGTKRLRNVGGDLGTAIRSFKSAMNENGETSQVVRTQEPDSIPDKPEKPD
ncbi:MAG: twin-arginine translocase TatA/TatE family subunit [Methylococcus sp.]